MTNSKTAWNPGWCIGTISYMDQGKIRVRSSAEDTYDRMGGGSMLHINGLTQYMFSYLGLYRKVVFRVVSIEDIERPYGKEGSYRRKNEQMSGMWIEKPYGREESYRLQEQHLFTAVPIGELRNGKFVPGVIDLPMVGSSVYACSDDELDALFCGGGGLSIGSLVGHRETRPTIGLDSLFSNHLAILGNTGSGKSTTARLLLTKVAEEFERGASGDGTDDGLKIKDEALFVVFDLHGDYECIAGRPGCVHRLAPDKFHLPVGSLAMSDWSAILDPSKRIQKPLLERAVKYSTLDDTGKKLLYAAFAYNAIRDTSVDSHAARKFQIAKYYEHITEELNKYYFVHEYDVSGKQMYHHQYTLLNPKSKQLEINFAFVNYDMTSHRWIPRWYYYPDSETNQFISLEYPRKDEKTNEVVYNPYCSYDAASRKFIPKYSYFYSFPAFDQNPSLHANHASDLIRFFNLEYGNLPAGLTETLEWLLKNYLVANNVWDASTNTPWIDGIIATNRKEDEEITIDDVVEALDFAFDEEEVHGNRQARSYSEGLVTQLNNLRDRYANGLFKRGQGKSIAEEVKNSKGLLVIDVSEVLDEDGLALLSTFVANGLFSRNRNDASKGLPDKLRPVYLVFDEAHRYIRQNILEDDSVFNRIAREGRKFGVRLAVISQIPSELSRVVLSQTGAFLIHRIQNAVDLDYIRRNVPSITADQVSRLPSFAPGTAVALGSSIPVTFELEVDDTYKDVTPPISMFRTWKDPSQTTL